MEKMVREKVIYLFNMVGDLELLMYIKKLEIEDNILDSMLKLMFILNDELLDTPLYYKQREIFLNYLGFKINEEGYLE